jgi:small subunit ribosomal protein S16
MTTKIRLARHGRNKKPFYRIVVADERSPRDGRYIEVLGYFNPFIKHDEEGRIEVDLNLAQQWLDKGAQPTMSVAKLLAVKGAKLHDKIAKKLERAKNNPPRKPKKESEA